MQPATLTVEVPEINPAMPESPLVESLRSEDASVKRGELVLVAIENQEVVIDEPAGVTSAEDIDRLRQAAEAEAHIDESLMPKAA